MEITNHVQQFEDEIDSLFFSLQLVICGAFYPNYFSSTDMDEAEVMKTMSGRDPFTTVIVSRATLTSHS